MYQDRTELMEIRHRTAEIMNQVTAHAANGKEDQWICPLDGCSHGTHGDGIKLNPKSNGENSLKCFGCGFSGDIIDLLGNLYNEQPGQAIRRAKAMLGMQESPAGAAEKPQERRNAGKSITTPPGGGNAPRAVLERESAQSANAEQGKKDLPLEQERNARMPAHARKEPNVPDKPAPDLTSYFEECKARLKTPKEEEDKKGYVYLAERGICTSTAAAYGIGFDPKADPAGSGHPCPRIIIPTNKSHYIGRSTDPNTPKQYAKMNNKGGTPGLFNLEGLFPEEVSPVFLVEGAFDALSIIEAGYAAVALNSTSNVRILLEALSARRTKAIMVICLDTDEAGKKATRALAEGLSALSVSYTTADICGEYKDPNEAWVNDDRNFSERLDMAAVMIADRPDNVSLYVDRLMAGEIERFKSLRDLKTGYPNLDEKAGGLYAGLYVIAAASSLGKTTFTHQMADQIAASGQEVLYFSLEQSRLEMVSKSLSRIMGKTNPRNAVSSMQIRKGNMTPAVLQAAAQYKKEVGERLSVVEGNFCCTVSYIREKVSEYHRRTGLYPVVMIDYLQIIQPEQKSRGTSTKEVMDEAITDLKRMSRELQVPVFAISSINRGSYTAPISFESLKESGNIEYTADVVWGLQYECVEEELFYKPSTGNNAAATNNSKRKRIKEAEEDDPRKIELVCLKNRYGRKNYTCYFSYYPQYDYFVADRTERKSEEPVKETAGSGLLANIPVSGGR